MKKDISYKSLIIGSAVYILCGLVINYLFGVGDVLSEQAIAAGEKEPPLLFGDNFLLYLFFIYGGYTFTFYAIFFYMIKKIIFSRQEPLSFLSLQFLPIFLRALGLLSMIIPGCRIISISQL